MRTMSISVSDELYEEVKHTVPAKGISHFVAIAIGKELQLEKQRLMVAYETAEQDIERQAELKEWDEIDVSN